MLGPRGGVEGRVVGGSVTARAPAKVNLVLKVGDLRSDGYHDLATVFHAVGPDEEVTVSDGPPGVRVEVRGEGADLVPLGGDNLAARAVRALAGEVGVDLVARGVTVSITKRIPVAAGLAGGSADAAAALVALDAWWRTGLDRDRLRALGASLGSDVPFALQGGTAVGTGRGELLAPVLGRGSYQWVLAFSPDGLSTPRVFAELDRARAVARGGVHRAPGVAGAGRTPPSVTGRHARGTRGRPEEPGAGDRRDGGGRDGGRAGDRDGGVDGAGDAGGDEGRDGSGTPTPLPRPRDPRAPTAGTHPSRYAPAAQRSQLTPTTGPTGNPSGPAVPPGVLAALRSGDAEALGAALDNDLQAPAVRLAPHLRDCLDVGRERGALGGVVSGSGPTCAFLVRDPDHAADLAAALTAAGVCRAVVHVTGPAAGASVLG